MRRRRLLIIDDERDLRAYVAAIAADLDYEVFETGDAEEFRRLHGEISPDVIFLDLVMPGADGVEILHWLADEQSDAAVMVCSGMDRKVLEAAHRVGESHGLHMLAALTKPVLPDDLESLLEPIPGQKNTPDAGPRSNQVEIRGGAPASSRGRETVLVVDDDKEVREVTAAQLEALDYRVLQAANGSEALAMLARFPRIELLFTDLMLSGSMNGIQLAETARRQRAGLRVLYSSGYASETVAEMVNATGAIGLLYKPYTGESLARRIRAALDEKQQDKIPTG